MMAQWTTALQRRRGQYITISDMGNRPDASFHRRQILVIVALVATVIFLLQSRSPSSHHRLSSSPLLQQIRLEEETSDSSAVMAHLPTPRRRCSAVQEMFVERDGSDPQNLLGDMYKKQSTDFNVFYRATAHIFWYDYVGEWGDYPRAVLANLEEVRLEMDLPLSNKSTWTWVSFPVYFFAFTVRYVCRRQFSNSGVVCLFAGNGRPASIQLWSLEEPSPGCRFWRERL